MIRFFSKKPTLSYHAVIDTGNCTVVAIDTYVPALSFLIETMMDTFLMRNVSPNYAARIQKLNPRRYPEWSYGGIKPAFFETNPRIITAEFRDRALIASHKTRAARLVIEWINRRREEKVPSGLLFQSTIYAEKERQAKFILERGDDERSILEAPYVVHDADRRGISISEAAGEILIQAKLDRDYLARTEKMRIDLFDKLKAATSIYEIDRVIEATRHFTL